ncbi:unknown [Prevotella sp. CAG:5226]|nr:unknown [Prevotella sp. CAG:5226]
MIIISYLCANEKCKCQIMVDYMAFVEKEC